MEGAGSRLSRASSRYGPTTTVFSGPVRRWKKKWVHVPPSPSSAFSSRSQSNARNNDNNSRLLLCRWTPISSAAANSSTADERPRRRFRYTPVVALEDQKKSVEKKIEDMEDVENTSEGEQSTVLTDKMFGKSNMDQIKNQEAEKLGNTSSHLNLDLGLQGHNANLELMNKMKGAQTKTASSGGFWLQ
ncbi:uncharacterized protein LOC126788380 [Argentina anserina]|uniref:uncharacterized protein LOC126788380 n=1 Tax=Argentina anserina TaxID=57926 RepID=UPI0021769152|nr:uncharacterized protein LOC126788380 [Potentilla anserina]